MSVVAGGTAKATAATAVTVAGTGAASVILGIPAAVLCAAVVGAIISHLPRDGQPDTKIPARVIAVVSDTFVGGWLAVAILQLTFFKEYGVHNIPAPAVGALCALIVQWARSKSSDYFERAFAVALDAFKRRIGGNREP